MGVRREGVEHGTRAPMPFDYGETSMTAAELLDLHADDLSIYWRSVMASRNEPGELATWVKAIWLDGYISGQASTTTA